MRTVLDQVFSALYGDNSLESDGLEDECSQWSSQFPHMRVIGQQVAEEVGAGTEEILMDTPPATAEPQQRVTTTQAETTSSVDFKTYVCSSLFVYVRTYVWMNVCSTFPMCNFHFNTGTCMHIHICIYIRMRRHSECFTCIVESLCVQHPPVVLLCVQHPPVVSLCVQHPPVVSLCVQHPL